MARSLIWLLADAFNRSEAQSTEDSHKNEGFLKSMWHNLTNHPAHQKKPGSESGEPEKKTDTSDKEKKDEPKSDSGSG